MFNIQGRWVRPGVELNITKDNIKTTVVESDETRHTLKHDYLVEANRLQLYSPTVREIKRPLKEELRIVMVSHNRMVLESHGGMTFWSRRIK